VGGSDGSLIVGDAVGFGGKAIRTVSFLGCTLATSGGLGTPPGGTGEFGVGSAITISRQRMVQQKQCQIVNAEETQRGAFRKNEKIDARAKAPNTKLQAPEKLQIPRSKAKA
jgi:hypothetical protein